MKSKIAYFAAAALLALTQLAQRKARPAGPVPLHPFPAV